MKIIEKYKELTEDIAVIKCCITSVEREIKRCIDEYRPTEIGAIDYSKDKVQASLEQTDIFSNYIKLHDLQTELYDLENELKNLYKQRDELEKVINDLGDIKRQVTMLKIKGYNNWRVAEKLHYSVRHIERINAEIKKDVGEMSV